MADVFEFILFSVDWFRELLIFTLEKTIFFYSRGDKLLLWLLLNNNSLFSCSSVENIFFGDICSVVEDYDEC